MRIVAIAFGILAVLAAAMSYNIWHASKDPVIRTPGAFEAGRAQLHQQLEEAKKTEGEVEKEAWDSSPALRGLIKGHEQRIEKLTGNSEAAEILAYDQGSIERLEKRIAELAAQQAARANQESEVNPADGTKTGAPRPAAESTAAAAVATPQKTASQSPAKPTVGPPPRPATGLPPKTPGEPPRKPAPDSQ